MTEIHVALPKVLTAETVIGLPVKFAEVPVADTYVFDLSGMGFVEPFGMLFYAAAVRQFKEARIAASEEKPRFKSVGHEEHSYAAHMGFYQSFGLKYGNEPGEATGGPSYLPLTRLPIAKLLADTGYKPVGAAVEAEAMRLASVLLQASRGPAFSVVAYALREVMRNVVEHSKAPAIWYAAQYWANRDCVEIAILDEGIGVRRSLSRNPALTVSSDLEALKLAIKPGVSGAAQLAAEDMLHPNEDPWRNTGYGLHYTSELCREGGRFLICSGTSASELWNLGARVHESAFRGTALRVVLHTTANDDLESFMRRISLKRDQSNAGRSHSVDW